MTNGTGRLVKDIPENVVVVVNPVKVIKFKKMKKVLVIGNFGYKKNQLGGQHVKTRDVYRLVDEQTAGNIDYYDTEDFKFRKWSIFTMFWKVIRCHMLFYLPAHNSLKYIFPIIYVLSAIFRVRIHYFVVGGWLREFLMSLPMHRWMLRRVAGIHVETKRLKNELEEYFHYENVDIFPNFRFFEFEPKRFESEKLRIVFMARVNKMKGLDWIFELAEAIEAQHLQDHFSITFYGPILKEDNNYFEENVLRFSFIEYKGVLEPKDIHETLSKYDVMLLPTHYYTEGLPGSVVDAYISGIPVIVSEWKHSHEFVENGVSGFIVPFENGQKDLIDKVLLLEKDRNLLHQLQANSLQLRMVYAPPSLEKILSGGGSSLRICFVSRVEQSKGLDTLMKVAQRLSALQLENKVSIDFYGQKNDDFFDVNLTNIEMFSYNGVLQPNEVIATLQKYDALIFPTHYDGEGCPGILVEALSAALPIIASDWKYNSEFVTDGVNGFLCDTFDAEEYIKAIFALTDPVLRTKMSKQSYITSKDFDINTAREKVDLYLSSL